MSELSRRIESPGIGEPLSVADAIRRTQDYLLSIQKEDGHWCGELEGDTILGSEYVLTMHFLGRTHERQVAQNGTYRFK